MLHKDNIEAIENMLEMIKMYESIPGTEQNKTDIFACALILKGMTKEKAYQSVKLIKDAIPMKASYESMLDRYNESQLNAYEANLATPEC